MLLKQTKWLVLSVATVALFSQTSCAQTFIDPVGDTFGAPGVAHDITMIGTDLGPHEIRFWATFLNPIAPASDVSSPNNVVGFLDIDVGQNANTGAISHQSQFSPAGPSDLGSEFFVDLFSEEFSPGMVEVVDTSTMSVAGAVPITFAPDSFSITMPLSMLGNDDGLLNYGFILGDFVDMSDEATNPDQPPAFSIPEPATCCFIMAAVTSTLFATRYWH